MNKHIAMIAALVALLPSSSVLASETEGVQEAAAPTRRRNVKSTEHKHRTEHRHHNHSHREAVHRGHLTAEDREIQRERHTRYHDNRHANLYERGSHEQQLPHYRTLDPERTSGKNSPMHRNAPTDRYWSEHKRYGRAAENHREHSGGRRTEARSERHRHEHEHMHHHGATKTVAE